MRYGNWKLVKYRAGKRGSKDSHGISFWRLYDLSKDVSEKHNLADKHPDVVHKVLDMLKRDGLL